MAFTEDFSVYLADFGQDATIDGTPTRVLFDSAYAEGFGAIATRQYKAGLPSAVAAAQGSTLVTGGNSYRVVSVQPDGTGWTDLMLEVA